MSDQNVPTVSNGSDGSDVDSNTSNGSDGSKVFLTRIEDKEVPISFDGSNRIEIANGIILKEGCEYYGSKRYVTKWSRVGTRVTKDYNRPSNYEKLREILAKGFATEEDYRQLFTSAELNYTKIPLQFVLEYKPDPVCTEEEIDQLARIMSTRKFDREYRVSRFTKLEIPTAESVKDYLYDVSTMREVVHKNLVNKGTADGASFDERKLDDSNRYKLYRLMYNDEIMSGDREYTEMAHRLYSAVKKAELLESNAISVVSG